MYAQKCRVKDPRVKAISDNSLQSDLIVKKGFTFIDNRPKSPQLLQLRKNLNETVQRASKRTNEKNKEKLNKVKKRHPEVLKKRKTNLILIHR
ncbi:TPA: hypothetical protein N2F43_003202 [Salmonella enterica]|nr:hypothetical protein [Salmonella enterica]